MREWAAITIAAMAVVTYATRASGLWLGNRIRMGPRLDVLLAAVPGAILVSLVAPAIAAAGVRGLVAGGLTVLTARWLGGNILIPMVVGVAAIWALRLV